MGNADQIRCAGRHNDAGLNEVRKNGRFCLEGGHNPTYVGYGGKSASGHQFGG